jgi:hypothetical protein
MSFEIKYKSIQTPSDLLNVPHFAALTFKTDTIHHEGDERSRTHPGHGYPAYTETINSINYTILVNESDVTDWVRAREKENADRPYDKTLYRIIRVNPVNINTELSVNIKYEN